MSEEVRQTLRRLLQIDQRLSDAGGLEALPSRADGMHDVPKRFGAYVIDGVLGRGGMGRVLSASRDVDGISQRVAIKQIRADRLDEHGRRRFRTERQVLALLKHPNIASLVDAGEDPEGQPFLVMEYVEGEPLLRHAQRLHLSVKARVSLFRDLVAAIAYAHEHSIVHRDLKSSNVLVDAHGVVKVIDFGIAKPMMANLGGHALESTEAAERFVSPLTAAPEQFGSGPTGPHSDLYSLGALLYELISEQPALNLRDRSFAEVERLIREQQPEPPSRNAASNLARQIDRDLDSVVLRCLRKRPEDRYQSAAELSTDLYSWLLGKPVSARRGERWYRLSNFTRRNQARLIALSAALLVVLLAVLYGNHQMVGARLENDLMRRFGSLLQTSSDRPAVLADEVLDQELLGVLARALETKLQQAGATWAEPLLHFELAEAMRRLGQPELALEVLGRSEPDAQTKPEHIRVFLATKARCLLDTRSPQSAINSINNLQKSLGKTLPFDLQILKLRAQFELAQVSELPAALDELGRQSLGLSDRQMLWLLQGDVARKLGDEAKADAAYAALSESLSESRPADLLLVREVNLRQLALAIKLRKEGLAARHFEVISKLNEALRDPEAGRGLASRALLPDLPELSRAFSEQIIVDAQSIIRMYGYQPERLEQAPATLRRGTSFNPEHGNNWVVQGHVLTNLGLLDQAEIALDRARQFKADGPWLEVNQGELLIARNQLDMASEVLSAFLKRRSGMRDDSTLNALVFLGEVRARLGDANQCRAYFGQALAINRGVGTVGRYSEVLRVRLLDVVNSELFAREALAMLPKNSWYRRNLGATLWLKWAERAQTSRNQNEIDRLHLEASSLMPNIADLLRELARYPHSHPIVAALKSSGVSLESRFDANPNSGTAMEDAVRNGNEAMVRALVAAGVEPDRLGAEATTPLGIAVSLGNSAMVKTLLELGANPRARDSTGLSVLDSALRSRTTASSIRDQLQYFARNRAAPGHGLDRIRPSVGYSYAFVRKPESPHYLGYGPFQLREPMIFVGELDVFDENLKHDGRWLQFEFRYRGRDDKQSWMLPEADRLKWAEYLRPVPDPIEQNEKSGSETSVGV